jgi:hypothetical protein
MEGRDSAWRTQRYFWKLQRAQRYTGESRSKRFLIQMRARNRNTSEDTTKVCPNQGSVAASAADGRRGGFPSGIDLCKFDVEGAEFEVLFGSTAISLTKCRHILIELHDPDGGMSARARAVLHGHGLEEIGSVSPTI